MSDDVPLLRKWKGCYNKDLQLSVFNYDDVVDALRKFKKQLIPDEEDSKEVRDTLKYLYEKFNEVFGVLDSQDKGRDSP